MAEKLGKKTPDGEVGESWEVSAHPNGVSRVTGGALAGMRLDELVRRAGPDLLGKRAYERYEGTFPLLVKLIDVHALASVQVHPNDEQARRLEGYRWGKTEAWYIIDRTPEARFYLGLVPGVTERALRSALAGHGARALLASPPVSAGDCLFVPPGTVHAVGNGVLLLEVQQSSDITYRVYDWDRVDSQGNRRELHLEKAAQVIDYSAQPSVFRASSRAGAVNRILSSDPFELCEARVDGSVPLRPRRSFSTGTVVKGSCALASSETGIDLLCGDSFVVPAETACRLDGERATVIMTFVAE